MHFVLVVPPLSATGDSTYYFWILQKWLHEMEGRACSLILSQAYLQALADTDRWEYSEAAARFNQYSPSKEIHRNVSTYLYEEEPVVEDGRSSTTRFVELINCEIPALVNFYIETFASIKKVVDEEVGIVTWLNNTSLTAAAKRVECQLVFNELGPLRKPYYRQTAYWDQKGVNGNTDVDSRWKREKADFADWLHAKSILNVRCFVRELLAAPESRTEMGERAAPSAIGIALQVETDSNALAYGRGWNNLILVNHARRLIGEDSILVRMHPNGGALYSGRVDLAPSPLAFLSRVSEVWTVNSSLGMEAIFWGIGARFFGECPIETLVTLSSNEQEVFLAWFFLCYLIPFDKVFDCDYYYWRFQSPLPSEIAQRHIEIYQSADRERWGAGVFPPRMDVERSYIQIPSARQVLAQYADIEERKRYTEVLEHDIATCQAEIARIAANSARKDELLAEKASEIERLSDRLRHPWREMVSWFWGGLASPRSSRAE